MGADIYVRKDVEKKRDFYFLGGSSRGKAQRSRKGAIAAKVVQERGINDRFLRILEKDHSKGAK